MDNQHGRTANWDSKIGFEDLINIVGEIDDFIFSNDKNARLLETRDAYYGNFLDTLFYLCEHRQILVQRDGDNAIIGVLGWITTDEKQMEDINKIRWTFKEVSGGDILYVIFCVISSGHIFDFRRELKASISPEVKEVRWFNAPRGRFMKRKIYQEAK